MGNGQYYDPATGRFLTRQPGRLNPYVPWSGDPAGALLGPLGLLVMLRWRRRGKKGKMDTILTLLLVGLALGIGLAACGSGGTETPQPPTIPTIPGTPTTPMPPTPYHGTPTPPQAPVGTPVVPASCPTPTLTPVDQTQTTVILACGLEIQGECINQTPAVGYNEGSGDEPPLNPYYSWAKSKGYAVKWYERETYQSKYLMAQAMSDEWESNTDSSFILIGHSAGADAVILAAYMVQYERIDSIALLDPTLSAEIPGETNTDISLIADQVAANVRVFLADSPWDRIDAEIQGAKEIDYPDIMHNALAVSDQVFNDARNELGWP
jgi:hypothetical protein